jgi:hypothetical protein
MSIPDFIATYPEAWIPISTASSAITVNITPLNEND